MSLLFLPFSTFLSLLFAAGLEIMLLPYLLHVIIELFFCNFKWLPKILEYFGMIVLFGPVCRVETVVVSDGRLDAGIYQELTDFSFTVLCGHVKRAEA